VDLGIAPNETFAQSLRMWRIRRKLSQLELSLRAGISQRHLSFLETGRSTPSRETLLLLAATLELPMRERNVLLTQSGFASVYRESSVQVAELATARRALEMILLHHEPYPALVLDGSCNILMANKGVSRITKLFPVSGFAADQAAKPNLIRLMLRSDGFRPYVSNWETFAWNALHRLRCDLEASPSNSELRAILAELRESGEFPSRELQPSNLQAEPLFALAMQNGQVKIRLFTMLTTFGSAEDVTLSELRIELFFPADSDTEDLLRSI